MSGAQEFSELRMEGVSRSFGAHAQVVRVPEFRGVKLVKGKSPEWNKIDEKVGAITIKGVGTYHDTESGMTRGKNMIFIVEMPDYQATGQWQLKHGDTRTIAYSEPGTLLDKFYRRELDIRPGDALRCRVDFETSYGPDHEVLSERYRIVEILEVLPAARPGAEAPSAAASQPQQREAARELETTP